MSRAGASLFGAGQTADIAIWGGLLLNSTQATSLAAGRRANTIGAANLVWHVPIVGQSPEPDQTAFRRNAVLSGTTVVAGPPSLDVYSLSIVQNYVYPGALQPQRIGPAVLSWTNAFPGIAAPQHKSGQTTVQSYLYPGALQPLQTVQTITPSLYATRHFFRPAVAGNGTDLAPSLYTDPIHFSPPHCSIWLYTPIFTSTPILSSIPQSLKYTITPLLYLIQTLSLLGSISSSIASRHHLYPDPDSFPLLCNDPSFFITPDYIVT
jgi:hypothetical protein